MLSLCVLSRQGSQGTENSCHLPRLTQRALAELCSQAAWLQCARSYAWASGMRLRNQAGKVQDTERVHLRTSSFYTVFPLVSLQGSPS